MNTLFDKIWDAHVVETLPGGADVLYIDRHYIHEVTSPQAFDGLHRRGIGVLRPCQVTATPDHNIPTSGQHLPVADPLSRQQLDALHANCARHGIPLHRVGSHGHGIVHVIGPESGLTRPGITIVCGDSHTSTHGAFGCIAFGIGTSEVEMTLAAQCLVQDKPGVIRARVDGRLPAGVCSKDIILHVIARLGTGGGTGYFVQFDGDTIGGLSMEARATICNMSIEMGARGGIIAPDEITFKYLTGRPSSPRGDDWECAVDHWRTLCDAPDATFGRKVTFRADDIHPMITHGTNPGTAIPVTGVIPGDADPRALEYMNFHAGEPMIGKKIDHVFLGSCTNGRLEDIRAFAAIVKGRKKSSRVTAWIVPGSKEVERRAIAEGLWDVLAAAGFRPRQPGCSACLAMNGDKIPPGQYCVSTANRNFEGRQGPGARTLLAGPLVAAAAAIAGEIRDPNEFL